MAAARTRRLWWILLVVLLVLAALAAVLAVWGNRDTTPERPLQQVVLSPAQLEQGRYLARAGDCAACHQTEDSLPFAGGLPIETPFGTIYGTNITPDPDRGIGRWSAEEFHLALTRGQAPGGRNLYPAMPYVSYHRMAREDADLIYGYLLQQRPSAQENRPPQVPFPLNLRVLLAGWNLLFFDTEPLPVASAGSSLAWERGRYLGNVMGLLRRVPHAAWNAGAAPARRLVRGLRDQPLPGPRLDAGQPGRARLAARRHRQLPARRRIGERQRLQRDGSCGAPQLAPPGGC